MVIGCSRSLLAIVVGFCIIGPIFQVLSMIEPPSAEQLLHRFLGRQESENESSAVAEAGGGMMNNTNQSAVDTSSVYPWARTNLRPLEAISEQSKETVLFWKIPRSGGTTIKTVYECLGQTIGKDTTSRQGINEAKKLGLVQSGLTDMIITSDVVYAVENLFDSQHKGRVLALFRHPIDRLVSKFYYLQTADWEEQYRPQWKRMTIEQFAESKNTDNNYMVKKLAGLGVNDDATRIDLRSAMLTIKKRFIVGLTDEMEESVCRFNFVMGVNRAEAENRECMNNFFQRSEGPIKHNENAHPKVLEGSPAWRSFARTNALDIKLYEYVLELFEQQRKQIDVHTSSIDKNVLPQLRGS